MRVNREILLGSQNNWAKMGERFIRFTRDSGQILSGVGGVGWKNQMEAADNPACT